ncbi:MAG: hypothetical protein ACU0A9_04225 [Alterinioella nitratireducens]|jgi:hypothetical protein|uniref:hypothetical protein n=1 Tax=Alterinioella nitratireducens TaxID=2735915 RepID=UPI0015531935|nr:hypothetical protein [Alterinioella nitratireducens]NPD20717.1 hypothetical protein [Alterinioella nitratireducens]
MNEKIECFRMPSDLNAGSGMVASCRSFPVTFKKTGGQRISSSYSEEAGTMSFSGRVLSFFDPVVSGSAAMMPQWPQEARKRRRTGKIHERKF